jgi:hypothetical protein
MTNGITVDTFSKMQSGNPYASYKKVTLGKLFVNILNPWTNAVEGIIVEGDPKANPESCIIDVWSEVEDTYFKKEPRNRKHLESGAIIKYQRPLVQDEVTSLNDISDDDIESLLRSPFLKFVNRLAKFTSTAPVYRVLEMAREMEKSVKIINAIEARIAEIDQGG